MSSNASLPLQGTYLKEAEFQALPREEQENYIELLHHEVAYRKSRKLLYYLPNPKQEKFHRSNAHIRAIFGANRSGKTTAGIVEFLWHMTGMYPEWYPEDSRYNTSIKGRMVATDFQKGVGEVIIPALDEWLDTSFVVRKYRNPIGIPVKWELKNGSVFDILTYEQSTEQFEGWKGHIAWFDEPPPRDKYIATLRGLVDTRGRCWLTLTPLTQPWIYDEIYTKSSPDVFVVTMDIRDNLKRVENGRNMGFLTEEAIQQFERSLTEEEKEARLHGRFLHLSGLVYKEFRPEINVCDIPRIQKHWTRYFCIDPHPRVPTACVWLAVDEKDNYYVYDELWLSEMNIEQIANAIHVQEGELKAHIRLIDPAMDKDNELFNGANIRKELMKYGVFCQRANNDPNLGKSRIKQALMPKYSHLHKASIPQLRISRDCTRVIYEFQHYQWDEYRRHADEKDPKEKVKKKFDHTMDCLRYIYNANPHYIPEVENEQEEEIEYAGTYAKYPVRKHRTGSYYSLVEPKNA